MGESGGGIKVGAECLGEAEGSEGEETCLNGLRAIQGRKVEETGKHPAEIALLLLGCVRGMDPGAALSMKEARLLEGTGMVDYRLWDLEADFMYLGTV